MSATQQTPAPKTFTLSDCEVTYIQSGGVKIYCVDNTKQKAKK